MLSAKRKKLLLYIMQHVEAYWYQPSVRELAEKFGVSVNAIFDQIQGLTAQGYFADAGENCPSRARALRITPKAVEFYRKEKEKS